MRQKRVKSATLDMLNHMGAITDIKTLKIDNDRKVYLEIGSGKGQFIIRMAKDHPEDLFIAMEMNINVCYRILEKKRSDAIENLWVILGNAIHVNVYLEPHTIDGIYLNFSDPWPKKRHHKRRLTAKTYLHDYQTILKKDGFLQLRTDHMSFFEDSMDQMSDLFDIMDVTHDLPPSDYMTEYEIKKRPHGPIYQAIGKVRPHD